MLEDSTTLVKRAPRTAVAAVMMAAILGCGLAGASTADAKKIYASTRGKKTAPCTHKKPCRTIARAISRARRGDEIFIAHGTYREEITITKDIKLLTSGGSVTINAAGLPNGILVTGSGAAGALVRGFTVHNATFEGILLAETSDITIERNVVSENDRGVSAARPEGECAPQGVIPGDCGEGLHLMAVTNSNIVSNAVDNNTGGILLTDENGPTAHNRIRRNRVLDNRLDCGITLAGHNAKAVVLSTAPGPPAMAGLAPMVGGVYGNLIVNNTASRNGTQGQGGGILLAAGPPGAGVYDNTVRANTAENNGLAGVTLHSHSPGQDLSGNTIINNIVSNDGIDGYPNGAPGDSDAGVTHSVGILLWSAATQLSGMTVSGNQVSSDYYGIWTKHVPAIPATANTFASTVVVHLMQT
jgi:parallel beta-helix repeat protein